jgi:hypothetical protein
VVDYAMEILANIELEVDELEDFAATVSKAAKVGMRAQLDHATPDASITGARKTPLAPASAALTGEPVRPA